MRDTVLRMGVVLLTAMLVLTAFSGGAAAFHGDDASGNTNIASNGAYVAQNSGNAGGGFSAFSTNSAGVTQVALASQTNTDNI
ncbi:hypothetical protein [Halogeometricum borinquense]|nr:hypothetical protein [Halogeometricum borinquense]